MSREIFYARFPDGTVRYGVYDRTFDVAYSNLYATREEAWAWWDVYRADAAGRRESTDPGQPVELATIGWRWAGRATADCITAGAEDFGLSTVRRHYGLPSWVAYDLAGRSGLTGTERADEALALLDAWKSRYADPAIGSDEGVCESCGSSNGPRTR